MRQLWSKDYNKLHKDNDEWFIKSRSNRYNFMMSDGSIRRMSFFCEQYHISSIIDYGCGFGNHFNISNNIKIINYDPFVEEYSSRPNQSADLVVCYNVLNVIEPIFFDDVLNDISDLTNSLLLCNIKVPGYWISDMKFYIEKISSRFKIKEFSYTKDVKDLNKMNLFILSEKNNSTNGGSI